MNSLFETGLIGQGETDSEKIFKTWYDIGFLDGLSEEHGRKLSLLFEEGARKLLTQDVYKDVEQLSTILLPCIRRIYSYIAGLVEDSSISQRYKNFPEMQEKAFVLFNVDDVLRELYMFNKFFMIFGELYLKNLDHEAEMCCLFSSNFQMGIYNQVKDTQRPS
jgi:hypothetical protein